MNVTPGRLASQPQILQSKLFRISLPYFPWWFSLGLAMIYYARHRRVDAHTAPGRQACDEGAHDIATRFDGRSGTRLFIPVSASSLRDWLHACSIYSGSWLSGHGPFNLEYAK